MALAAAKTFVAAEVLYASDLNALNTNILNNPMSLISPWTANLDADGYDLADLGEIEFRDESADPTADGRLRRSGDELTLRMQDARTNTVARPWALWVDTTGTPAASIGVGMLFQAESGDENPCDFGALDFVASDVTAGSEDTYFSVQLRVAGSALDEKWRWGATSGAGFAAICTHAVTADRTYTFADADFTIGSATQAEMEAGSSVSVPVTPGRMQYHPGVAKAWGVWNNAGTLGGSYNISSVTDTGAGNHTVNLTTAFSAATTFTVLVSGAESASGQIARVGTLAAGTIQVTGRDADTPFGASDLIGWYMAAFGDQ